MKNVQLKEDNRTGFHTGTVTTGVDRPVTGGNDAPLDVNLDQLKAAANQAKNTIMGKGSKVASGGSGSGSGDTYIYNDNRIFNSTDIDNAANGSGGGSAVADGLAWFGAHWKEAAIVAGAAAIIVAIAKLVKVMNKQIKVRYNKVVKTLQRAQKDFTLKPDGLNMKSVLPGVGSGIFDWVSRMWTANWKSKKNIRGNIGLHPFCAQYVVEIADDYRTATDAFSKIKLGAEESSVDDNRNTDTTVDQETNKAVDNISTSVYSGKVYNSFYEAYRDDFLNEGVAEDKVNESVLAMISGGIALASLAARAGSFLYQRFKDGKPTGDVKKIQVTKESTREICYAIINNYADKYINMQQVWKELGISTESLADVSTSDCDKLQTILKKYSKPEKNAYTKQYERIHKAYTTMLRHYYAIGDGIISNFVKYTEAKDEKHANLVVASKEKLQNMWDSQKDFYDNNFSHVIIEITSSEPYIKYLDFIIEKVIPVFKSGLASDADYVLDIVPKKGEYYLLRQTGNGQANVGNIEEVLGNVAIAQITNFDKGTKEISFKLIGKVKDENGYQIDQDGTAYVNKDSIDYKAYKDQDDNKLNYGKWLSLDPIPMGSTWSPETFTDLYWRIKDKEDQYIYGIESNGDNGMIGKIVFVKTFENSMEVKSAQIFELDNKLTPNDFQKFIIRTDKPFNMGFIKDEQSPVKYYMSYYKYWKPETEEVKTTEDLAKIINKDESEKEKAVKFSDIYSREFDNGERTYDQYVYAYGDKDDKDEFNTFAIITNKKGSNEILSMELYKLNNYFTVDDLNKILTSDDFDPKFSNTSTKFSESKLKNYVERYGGNKTETQEVETTDDLIAIINKKIEPEKAVKFSDIYSREFNTGDASIGQFVYAYGDKDDKDEYDTFVLINTKDKDGNEIISRKIFSLDNYIDKQTVENILMSKCDPVFTNTGNNYQGSKIKEIADKYKIELPKPEELKTTDDLINKFNEKVESKAKSKMSALYERTIWPDNNPQTQYVYASGDEDDKNEYNLFHVIITTHNGNEISNYAIFKTENYFKDDFLNNIFVNKMKFKNVGDVDQSNIKGVLKKYLNGKISPTPVVIGTIDKLRSILDSLLISKNIEVDVNNLMGIVELDKNNTGFDFNGNEKETVKIKNREQAGEKKFVGFSAELNTIKCIVFIRFANRNKGEIELRLATFDKPKDYSNNVNIKVSDWGDKVITNTILNCWNDLKSKQNVSTSAMTVTYSYDSQVSESSQNGSITNITRRFSEKKRNWYVLSEAIYDDGSNKVSRLDDPKFVSRLNERCDCTGFAKTSRIAKFMKFESVQNYQLISESNYVPSLATPLYESVLLVKLDKMDNITDKVYLGKFRING